MNGRKLSACGTALIKEETQSVTGHVDKHLETLDDYLELKKWLATALEIGTTKIIYHQTCGSYA